MANDCGRARSNYFHVVDVDALRDALPEDIAVQAHTDDPTSIALFSEECDTGNWPNSVYNEDTDEYDDIDLVDLIAPHVVDGDVVVLMEVGHQKMRYVYGNAVAFNNKRETLVVNLDDIYDLAKDLGTTITAVEY
jgi:hypothetical protein